MFRNKRVEGIVDLVIGFIYNVTVEFFDRLGELFFYVFTFIIMLVATPIILITALVRNILIARKNKVPMEDFVKGIKKPVTK